MYMKLYNNVLKILHNPSLNRLCCSKKYPWGWICQDYVSSSLSKYSGKDCKRYMLDSDFIEGSYKAYNVIFDYYSRRGDFLKKQYTTPKLAIAINSFIESSTVKVNVEKPIITNIKILDVSVEYERTYSNNKVLGMWNDKEIEYELLMGLAGPEVELLYYSNFYTKQVVSVQFIQDKRSDVWTFERHLEDGDWQVKNINNIIIND